MADEDELKGEDADREFHMVIARATGNGAIIATIENLWDCAIVRPWPAIFSPAREAADWSRGSPSTSAVWTG
jgi:DNA-binding FadR family transcriptional regulator